MNGAEFLFSVALLCTIGCIQIVIGQSATGSFSINQGHFSCGPGGNLRCSGNASTTTEGLLKLTPDPPGRTQNGTNFSLTVGVALYKQPVKIMDRTTNKVASFNISFSFRIEPGAFGPGDGMAFVMFTDETWIGSPGLTLGAFDEKGLSRGQILAVEFDTFANPFIDTDNNHIGIDINSISSEVARRVPFRLDADRVNVWISNNPSTSVLEVRLSSNSKKPAEAFISYRADLLNVFDVENVWVGFSASNGWCSCFSYYTIFDINFDSTFGSWVLPIPSAPFPAPETSQKSSSSTGLIAGVTVGIAGILIGGCLLLLFACRNRRIRSRSLSVSHGVVGGGGAMVAEEFQTAGLSQSVRMYDYDQLSAATSNFSDALKLGEGGFGSVYRGSIPGTIPPLLVAVKKVSSESRQGEREFVAEVSTIGLLRHRNIVQLLGWCSEGQGNYLLVYEFMPNGSLDRHLFPRKEAERQTVLSWEVRFNILGGLAAALHYLHEGWRQQVIHRDVKSSNIMLDDNFNAMLGDFGLARVAEHNENLATTSVAGTYGYIAPEAPMGGKFTVKTDVFAFGAVCLEIACGRKVYDINYRADEVLLVDYVWEKLSADELLSVVDAKLEGEYNVQEAEDVLLLGLLCSHPKPGERPPMHRVLEILSGSVDMPPIPKGKPEGEHYTYSYSNRRKKVPLKGRDGNEMGHHYEPNSLAFTTSTSHYARSRSAGSSNTFGLSSPGGMDSFKLSYKDAEDHP